MADSFVFVQCQFGEHAECPFHIDDIPGGLECACHCHKLVPAEA